MGTLWASFGPPASLAGSWEDPVRRAHPVTKSGIRHLTLTTRWVTGRPPYRTGNWPWCFKMRSLSLWPSRFLRKLDLEEPNPGGLTPPPTQNYRLTRNIAQHRGSERHATLLQNATLPAVILRVLRSNIVLLFLAHAG